MKLADTLIGATDDIQRPPETEAFDWECEVAVVVGREVRRAKGEEAEQAIAGGGLITHAPGRPAQPVVDGSMRIFACCSAWPRSSKAWATPSSPTVPVCMISGATLPAAMSWSVSWNSLGS